MKKKPEPIAEWINSSKDSQIKPFYSDNDSALCTDKDNEQDTTQYTNNDTIQYTTQYTIGIPDKCELYEERLVANVTKRQKKYIKETARKFDNESAMVRYMIDYFMKNISFK
jgi:hypothetical protein